MFELRPAKRGLRYRRVSERADGVRRFDEDDGPARPITGWAGLAAAVIANRIRAAVDYFAAVPPHDDVAVLVLAARPGTGCCR
jgi:hypothetical protein